MEIKKFDMHIHTRGKATHTPEELLSKMSDCGIYGGAIFSNGPKEYWNIGAGEERLWDVLSFCEGHPNRLFPVLWIHPDEKNAKELIKKAIDNGICGFKMICNNFYVYEKKSMDLLEMIAEADKPVFFHSGILWDATNSSSYNRPLFWENLINVKNLRFSMGHCSWPWIDECIALYGKFLNGYTNTNSNEKNAEMFFDITPGTPEIYRRELLTKLYTVGYDVIDNIMFGSDASVDTYNGEWLKKWLSIDGEILDSIGSDDTLKQKLYHDNLLRFLGKKKKDFIHNSPTSDNSNAYEIGKKRKSDEVIDFARAEYKRQGLDEFYKLDFDSALISELTEAYSLYLSWDGKFTSKNEKANLLLALMLGYKLKEKYDEKGIPNDVLLSTLSDIGIWARTYYSYSGKIGIEETGWLGLHLSFKLFRLGRLQYEMTKSPVDFEDLKKGDCILSVHIPEGDPLLKEKCEESLDLARKFFAKYFPEHNYSYFYCHSWLLDKEISMLIGESSNIAKFASLFKEISKDESLAATKYVFRWNIKPDEVAKENAETKLQKAIKTHLADGKKLYETSGIIKK